MSQTSDTPAFREPQTREEARELVEELQQRFDLIDDATMLRGLIEQMDARHDDAFGAFYNTILHRFMEAAGLTEITFNTEHMLAEMFAPKPLECEAGTGTLTYRIVKDESLK